MKDRIQGFHDPFEMHEPNDLDLFILAGSEANRIRIEMQTTYRALRQAGRALGILETSISSIAAKGNWRVDTEAKQLSWIGPKNPQEVAREALKACAPFIRFMNEEIDGVRDA